MKMNKAKGVEGERETERGRERQVTEQVNAQLVEEGAAVVTSSER